MEFSAPVLSSFSTDDFILWVKCCGRIWGIEVEGEVSEDGGSCPLTPLLWEVFPLGNSGKQWVSQPAREGFEGTFQDKCKYATWNNLSTWDDFWENKLRVFVWLMERMNPEVKLREQNLTKIRLLQRISLIKLKSWHLCQSWALKRE